MIFNSIIKLTKGLSFKVSRDQQTWRKEFKGETSKVVPAAAAPKKVPQKQKSKKLSGLPICEYQERGNKWVVEHQTKESATAGLTIEITDPKQQVYMFNCEGVTLQVKGGKVKSIIMDKCTKCAVVFGTCISSCEMVNCKKMQVQTTGVCPTFSIDKTDGCLIYMSKESVDVSSFVTSQSSEMNVSFPTNEDGEHKEVPIPEQFIHKLSGGSLSSEVSDLYH